MLQMNDRPHRPKLTRSLLAAFGSSAAARVETLVGRRSDAVRTPLLTLPSLADKLGLGALHVKDESRRLGLNSFKALGGWHAVSKLLNGHAAADVTFACASAGNHGRGVAVAAALHGAGCVVFVASGVSTERRDALTASGARVITVEGCYDDAVASATRVSAQQGWVLVPDTSWRGCEETALLVMQGYLALLAEVLREIATPTHLFIQAGVGGLAGALAGHLASVAPDCRIVVVQSARAASLLHSARAGEPRRIAAGDPTVMDMLECYEPSLLAWRVLSARAHAFMTLDEEEAQSASSGFSQYGIRSTPSGAAGFGALLQAARTPALRNAFQLDEHSRVLLTNTEGPLT
jgi:diaminopropionate ammonia-lyase